MKEKVNDQDTIQRTIPILAWKKKEKKLKKFSPRYWQF